MTNSSRGPERRHATDPAKNSSAADTERRAGDERRRNGYISSLELCRDLPYEQVESILERCPRRELAPGEILLEPGQANHYLFFLLDGELEIHLK